MNPTLPTLIPYQDHYPYVPVMVKRPLATFDPIAVAKIVHQMGNGFALTIDRHQRYSYFSFKPQRSLTGRQLAKHQRPANETLQAILNQYRTPRIQGLPPFTGGLIGYFGYEYVQQFVPKLHLKSPVTADLDDLGLFLVTSVLVYDHRHHELGLTQLIPTADLAATYAVTQTALTQRLAAIIEQLQQPIALPPFDLQQPLHMQVDQATYARQVDRIRQHIYAGDIFQMIYANPCLGTMSGSLLAVYQQLQKTAAPYTCYFKQANFEMTVASPETLVTKDGEQVATYPLAGTRRRGRTPAEDQQLAHELQTSPKEIAEHNMLVDLGRNDLGQVAKFKSVRVTNLRRLIRYSQVMHLGSRVAAEVAPTTTALQVLAATFPAGTLAGAPKIEAMTLINHYEQVPRGVYGGCFGYLDCNGNLDMAIGIRLAYRINERLVIPAGAGIVADSIGAQEFKECQNKQRVIVNAIQGAKGRVKDGIIN
ncbi:anthranilate synthase component I family protein [Lactiplantibacillus plantarum]|uniref:anthranilate synthase component I family protein n=1 Tax=Lactiplantibacillus plantarum TaxID=1590 RepID=UPI00217D7DE6|nr:anthranilate synthase component I family protein [Lactiplantibacillus plantarum]MCS6155661.1 anthranilate synthase component I family protein [Lactiplantibacillus plantarum]